MDQGGPGAGRGTSVGEQLLALELALAGRDVASIDGGYEALLDDDFVELGQSGRWWTRDETLAVLHGDGAGRSVTIERFGAAAVAEDVVLVTYELEEKALDGRGARSRRSSLWRRRRGRWQLRFHQGTAVSDEAQ